MTKDNAPTYVTSDDEAETPARSRPAIRAAKRAWADSSPLAERVRVVVARKPLIAASIFLIAPSSHTGSPTPSKSQAAPSAPPSKVDSVTPSVPKSKKELDKARRKKTSAKRVDAPDQDAELKDLIKRIAISSSNAYEGYSELVIDPHDYPPKYHYKRLIGESYTSNLRTHRATCIGPAVQTSLLEDHRVFRSSAKLTPQEVREWMALWLQHLYSRDVQDSKPHRATVSLDIKRIFEVTQKHITDSLAETPGVLHIGLDLCLTNNRYDYLGLVLFWAKLDPKLVIFMERFVLECIHFKESHTGKHLAKMLVGILQKFKIEDRVWGLVGDDAANNVTMMTHISKYGLKWLTSNQARLHCLLHVFNLVAQNLVDHPLLPEEV
ncbi:hypothetical protein FRC07_014725 [Ceratobasidium sp. 392]|nr:hypothetical protein FRC07_014725 [Ceratobasidium sp. 392]